MKYPPRNAIHAVPGIPGVDDGYWVNIGTRNKIRSKIDNFRNALGVHAALSMLACDYRSRSFDVTVGCVAESTGISRKATLTALEQLKKIGAVRVVPSKRDPKHFAWGFTLLEDDPPYEAGPERRMGS